MAIQYISNIKKNYYSFHCSDFTNFDNIDMFEFTIVDLSSADIWDGITWDHGKLKVEEKFKQLHEAISNSLEKHIIFLLPQNLEWINVEGLNRSRLIADIRPTFKNALRRICFLDDSFDFAMVRGTTSLKNGTVLKSDFIFKTDPSYFASLTENNYSKQLTTVKNYYSEIIYTFLDLQNENEVSSFLETIGIQFQQDNIPAWLKEYQWFTDKELHSILNKNNDELKRIEQSSLECKNKLQNNNHFKSILSSTGDDLCLVVFEILEEILGIETKDFVDKKLQDLDFALGESIFLVEIKGINTNVKSSNIGQLEQHELRYKELLEEKQTLLPETIKKLLIINHQRLKSIHEREPINNEQIHFAKQKQVLIIETNTLLTILEQYRNKNLSREEIINKISSSVGLLVL